MLTIQNYNRAVSMLGYDDARVTRNNMRIENNPLYVAGFNAGIDGLEYSNTCDPSTDFWACYELGFHHGNDEACNLHSEAMDCVQCD